MSRYRKIEVRMWGDERFNRLSPIPACGQGLWLYLLTGPHTGPIPGLFRAGRAAMAEELGWDQQAFDKAFAEALAEGLVKADLKARVMWLPNAIKYNKPESPNVVKSWAAEFDLIPECDLKREAYECLKSFIYGLEKGYPEAFDQAFGKPSSKPSTKTMPIQEQEQEQEQDKSNRFVPGKPETQAGKPESATIADLETKRQAKEKRLGEITVDAFETYNHAPFTKRQGGNCANVQLLTDDRRKNVKRCIDVARAIVEKLTGKPVITRDFWVSYWETVNSDDFAAGRHQGGVGHANWKPDFEYLTRPDVMTKLFDKAMSEAQGVVHG